MPSVETSTPILEATTDSTTATTTTNNTTTSTTGDKDTNSSNIVFLRRQDGSVDFQRSWSDYKAGFGDLDGEFWLGLNLIHLLTSSTPHGLSVNITTWSGASFWSFYSNFTVGPETENYRLHVGGYDVMSTAGDGLTFSGGGRRYLHDGMEFSTKDHDSEKRCAVYYKAGWWYNTCYRVFPTGVYLTDKQENGSQGLQWSLIGDNTVKYLTFTLVPM